MRVLKSIATVVGVLVAATAVHAQNVDRLSLGNKSESLELKGDLRIRYERSQVEAGSSEATRNRLRSRLRLGMKFKTEWGWEIAAGLATGSADSTSTNATWDDDGEGHPFATGDIRLDYAYATHKFGESAKLTLGQQKNPFVNGGILWDSDVRPAGFAYQQSFGPGFVTAGYFNGTENKTESLGELYALQTGAKIKGDVSFTAAGAYYNWNSQAAEEHNSWYVSEGYDADSGVAIGADDELKVASLYGEVSMKIDDKSALKFWTEIGQNMGADSSDAEDNNQFYTFAGEFKIETVKLSAQYYSNGVYSAHGGLLDGDSDGLNWEGIRLKAGYGITKNFGVGLMAQFSEEIEKPAGSDAAGRSLYQVDLKYKF